MIAQIFNVVAPVFLVAGFGYFWVRRGQPFDTDTVGGIVMNIGAPCLVFTSLTGATVALADAYTIAGVAAISTAAAFGFGFVGLRLLNQPVRTFLPTLVHPNTGNMGLPLCLMAFGDTGLSLAIAYYVVNAISQYTLGLSIASGTFHPSQLVRQPVVWAVAAALAVRGFDLTLPVWIATTAELIAGFVIPAMLLMLGTSLARIEIRQIKSALAASLARLLGGLAMGLLAIWAFELSGVAAGVVLIQSAMPAAVFNIVFAERFNNAPDTVSATILISTLISFATLPLLVAFALNLAA